jgi:propionyl-CoA carboxylase alpha chain/3-methylcrotonyl-CoA carboxylase alpha subunit
VAAGEPLPLKQDEIRLNGWAMEARLYAEDPASGFLPSIGRLKHFHLPDDVRVDTGVEAGGEVSQFYDPMIAKLIVHEPTREAAAARLATACGEVEVWPVKTNAGFLKRCLEHPRFVAGDVDTGLIAAEGEGLTARPVPDDVKVAVIAVLAGRDAEDEREAGSGPWSASPAGAYGFRLNGGRPATQRAVVDGQLVEAEVCTTAQGVWSWSITLDGRSHDALSGPGCVYLGRDYRSAPSVAAPLDVPAVFRAGDVFEYARPSFGSSGAGGAASDGALRAPMPGRIVAAPLKAGDAVVKGQPVVVLEAMKMEHALTAPFDGVVETLSVAVGDQATEGAVLAVVKAND